MADIVIIGGGITGLAAAYRLRQLAPNRHITLIEAANHLGGKIGTEKLDDFVIEWGPDCFLSRKPRGIGLCEELGIADQLVGRDPNHAKTFVLRHGRLHRLPEGLTGLIPTNLDALSTTELLSETAKSRLAQEPFLPPYPDNGDESVGHFIARRLGSETLDNLIEPLMGGIYAGQVDQLSLAATFPQLRQLELTHGSLLKGLTDRPATTSDATYPPFVSFTDGMQTLVSALVKHLEGVEIWRKTAVTHLEKTDTGYQVKTKGQYRSKIDTSVILLTTPAYVSGKLLADVDGKLAETLATIPYASTALVNLAFDETDIPPLDGYGYVIPRAENREALACTWSSRKWQHRAPNGKVLLRLYIGRYGQEDVANYDDTHLLNIALNEIYKTLNLQAKPIFHRIIRYPKAMPQYNLGHPEKLTIIQNQLAQNQGLFLAGAAFQGIGIPDCIGSGEKAAYNTINYFKNL